MDLALVLLLILCCSLLFIGTVDSERTENTQLQAVSEPGGVNFLIPDDPLTNTMENAMTLDAFIDSDPDPQITTHATMIEKTQTVELHEDLLEHKDADQNVHGSEEEKNTNNIDVASVKSIETELTGTSSKTIASSLKQQVLKLPPCGENVDKDNGIEVVGGSVDSSYAQEIAPDNVKEPFNGEEDHEMQTERRKPLPVSEDMKHHETELVIPFLRLKLT